MHSILSPAFVPNTARASSVTTKRGFSNLGDYLARVTVIASRMPFLFMVPFMRHQANSSSKTSSSSLILQMKTANSAVTAESVAKFPW